MYCKSNTSTVCLLKMKGSVSCIDEEALHFGAVDSNLVGASAIQQIEEPVRRILAFKLNNRESLLTEYNLLAERAKSIHLHGESLIPTDIPKLTQSQMSLLSSALEAIEERRGFNPAQKSLTLRLFSWLGGATITTSALVDLVSIYLRTIGWTNPDGDFPALRTVEWKTAMAIVDRLCYREDLLRSGPTGAEFLYFELKESSDDKRANKRKAWATVLESMGLFVRELSRLETDPPALGSALVRLRKIDESERRYVLDRQTIESELNELAPQNQQTFLGKRSEGKGAHQINNRSSHMMSLFNLLPGSIQRPMASSSSASKWSLLPSVLSEVDIRDPLLPEESSNQNPQELFSNLIKRLRESKPNQERVTRLENYAMSSKGPLYKVIRFDNLLKVAKKRLKTKTASGQPPLLKVSAVLAELFEPTTVIKHVSSVLVVGANLHNSTGKNSGLPSNFQGKTLDNMERIVPCPVKMFRLRKCNSFIVSGYSFIQLEEFSCVSFSYGGSVMSPALAGRNICTVEYDFKKYIGAVEKQVSSVEKETPEVQEESQEPAESLKTKSKRSSESEAESEENRDFDAQAAQFGLKPGQGFVVYDDYLSDCEFQEDIDAKERERIKQIRSNFSKQPKEFKSCHIVCLIGREESDKLCIRLKAMPILQPIFPLSIDDDGPEIPENYIPRSSGALSPVQAPNGSAFPCAPPPSPISALSSPPAPTPDSQTITPSMVLSPLYPQIFSLCHTNLTKKFPEEDVCRTAFPNHSATSVRNNVHQLVTFSTLVDPRLYEFWGLGSDQYLKDLLRPRRPTQEYLNKLAKDVVKGRDKSKGREYLCCLLRFLNGQPVGLSRVNDANLQTLQTAFPEIYRGLLSKLVYYNILLSMYLVKWNNQSADEYLCKVFDKFDNSRWTTEKFRSAGKGKAGSAAVEASKSPSIKNGSTDATSAKHAQSWEEAVFELFDREAIKLARNRLRCQGLVGDDARGKDDDLSMGGPSALEDFSEDSQDKTQPVILTGKLRKNTADSDSFDPSAPTESIRESADLLDSCDDGYLEEVHYRQRSMTDSESVLGTNFAKTEQHGPHSILDESRIATGEKEAISKFEGSLYGEFDSQLQLEQTLVAESLKTTTEAGPVEPANSTKEYSKKGRLNSKKHAKKKKESSLAKLSKDSSTQKNLSTQINENLDKILAREQNAEKKYTPSSLRTVPATSTKRSPSKILEPRMSGIHSPPTTSSTLMHQLSSQLSNLTRKQKLIQSPPQTGSQTPQPAAQVTQSEEVPVLQSSKPSKSSKSSLQKARTPSACPNHRKPYQNPLLQASSTQKGQNRPTKPSSVTSRTPADDRSPGGGVLSMQIPKPHGVLLALANICKPTGSTSKAPTPTSLPGSSGTSKQNGTN